MTHIYEASLISSVVGGGATLSHSQYCTPYFSKVGTWDNINNVIIEETLSSSFQGNYQINPFFM